MPPQRRPFNFDIDQEEFSEVKKILLRSADIQVSETFGDRGEIEVRFHLNDTAKTLRLKVVSVLDD